MLDKVSLIVIELVLPIVAIHSQVDLLGGPERGFGLLVHLPDLQRPGASIIVRSCAQKEREFTPLMTTYLSVLDGEENESALGLLQQRLLAFGKIDLADKLSPGFLQGLSLDRSSFFFDRLFSLAGRSLQLGVEGGRGGFGVIGDVNVREAISQRLAGGFELGRHCGCDV